MNLFSILNNLYTNNSSKWIIDIEENDEEGNFINPFIIQEWLCLNDSIRTQARFLDKYTFSLNLKMYLSLAWSIIPKSQKAPFVKWIPKIDSEEEWGFILDKVRKHLVLSDNDYKSLKPYLLKYIKSDMVTWFSAYGINKRQWKKHNLDFSKIKDYGEKRIIPQKGLAMWGL